MLSQSQNHSISPNIALIALSIIWGINFSVLKVVLTEIGPLALNALRFPLAAVTLLIILRCRGPIPLPQKHHWAQIVVLGLLCNLVYQILFIFGIDATLAGNASLVLATTPIWTIVLSTVLFQKQHTITTWIAVLAGLGGMVLVISGGSSTTNFSDGLFQGDLILVAAAITWALYTVGAQDMIIRYGALSVTSWTLWIGTIGLVLAGLPSLVKIDFRMISLMAWAGVFYAGTFSIAIAYLLWNYGLEHIGTARTATFSNLVPVVALITAAIWLNEETTVSQILGAIIITGGVWLARSKKSDSDYL